jgi:hypothetical protein
MIGCGGEGIDRGRHPGRHRRYDYDRGDPLTQGRVSTACTAAGLGLSGQTCHGGDEDVGGRIGLGDEPRARQHQVLAQEVGSAGGKHNGNVGVQFPRALGDLSAADGAWKVDVVTRTSTDSICSSSAMASSPRAALMAAKPSSEKARPA